MATQHLLGGLQERYKMGTIGSHSPWSWTLDVTERSLLPHVTSSQNTETGNTIRSNYAQWVGKKKELAHGPCGAGLGTTEGQLVAHDSRRGQKSYLHGREQD